MTRSVDAPFLFVIFFVSFSLFICVQICFVWYISNRHTFSSALSRGFMQNSHAFCVCLYIVLCLFVLSFVIYFLG